MRNPEHLVPHGHFEEEPQPIEPVLDLEVPKKATEEVVVQESEPSLTPKESFEKRKEVLAKAPDLEGVLREEWKKERGTEAPEGINLSLRTVETFRRTVKDAQDLRKVVRYSKNPEEKATALSLYTQKNEDIKEITKHGLSFEAGYREYLRAQREYFDFVNSLQEISQLQTSLDEPDFKDAKSNVEFDKKATSRLGTVMRETETMISADKNESLVALASIYPKGSKEYIEAAELLSQEKEEKPETKGEISKKIEELKALSAEKWENPMVRYFWQTKELDKMLEDFGDGKDVIETQSVIKCLNKLDEWEKHHQRTTIGGVLVGPPGVGKTTMVKHYLEQKERDYVYVDLSEDVTRYLLYGTKAIEFKSPTEYYERLAQDFESMDEEGLKKFISEHAGVAKNVFGAKGEEATVVAISQINEAIDKGKAEAGDSELGKKLDHVKGKIGELTQTAFRRELAGQFSHLVTHNGWRDGVIVAALRRGDNIIFDEFNKTKNWSLIYGLMTAKPGEQWYFADNDENIKIPEDWRMYFTANIGRKHGGFQVAEALASRANGKVMEVDYAPTREEMRVALASLSNAEGDFLRSKDDLAKLYVLINEVFPRVRNYTEGKDQTIPISYRLIRDLGEKLIMYNNPKTNEAVYQPTDKSFDEALYEVMVDSYKLYEDQTIPKEVVNIATSVGLLLDNSVKEKVTGLIGQETYDERKTAFTEHAEDFRQIVKKIQGLSRDMADETIVPEIRKF